MSWRFIAAAWLTDTPDPKSKLVLLRLADAASDDGFCYPSHKRVAEDTGLSVSSIQRALKGLEKRGWLIVDRTVRSNGSQTSNTYRLCLDPLVAMTPPPSQADHPPLVTLTTLEPPRSILSEEKKDPEPRPAASDTSFEEFWKTYPRKVGKGKAEERWKKLRPSKALILEILAAVAAQSVPGAQLDLASRTSNSGECFVPHPATWLHQKRWTDPPEILKGQETDAQRKNREYIAKMLAKERG